jgi:hypothetical protein
MKLTIVRGVARATAHRIVVAGNNSRHYNLIEVDHDRGVTGSLPFSEPADEKMIDQQ